MAHETKNILVNRIHDRALKAAARRYLSGRLLDIGCGVKPHAAMLTAFVEDHIGVDHPQTGHDRASIDALSTAYQMPFADGTFDSAICTAVLEHLEEPGLALRECRRLLRPGGIALYSVPFIWHLHEEPRDFYRFSKHGLRYQFEKAGFEIAEVVALSGFWVTFGQLLVYNLYRLNRRPLRWTRLIDALGLLMQGVFYGLDRLDRTEQWTWMYMVVARNPVDTDVDA